MTNPWGENGAAVLGAVHAVLGIAVGTALGGAVLGVPVGAVLRAVSLYWVQQVQCWVLQLWVQHAA